MDIEIKNDNRTKTYENMLSTDKETFIKLSSNSNNSPGARRRKGVMLKEKPQTKPKRLTIKNSKWLKSDEVKDLKRKMKMRKQSENTKSPLRSPMKSRSPDKRSKSPMKSPIKSPKKSQEKRAKGVFISRIGSEELGEFQNYKMTYYEKNE
jgi:hypothetical protein